MRAEVSVRGEVGAWKTARGRKGARMSWGVGGKGEKGGGVKGGQGQKGEGGEQEEVSLTPDP